jgi:hypothetical protein
MIGLTMLAPATFAQEVDVVGPLTEGVRCFGSNAREDLLFNVKKLEAADDVIGAALNAIAADEARCAPMREAATELAATYVVVPAPTPEEAVAISTRELVEKTLAEADRRAGSLKFEVGPPPRHMTKGRGGGP